ncbi:hypothetical protein P3X46_032709 [Hevea brasiliensis]|uniref:SWI/SNF complex subunit SWI3D n=1 Tax=Hevea brasiliensis TaxID=3981 RepID=A0ABQ9KFN5_HEVBR|nr:hypothetical protein P3X46_032709 [Hevea brasiliensis]
MEEKLTGTTAAAGAESPASAEPPSSRRRAGGLKRKANVLSTSNSSSTPSKRLTREKALISHPSIHNGGPLTRAHQSPNNLSSAAYAATGCKLEEKVAMSTSGAVTVATLEEEVNKLEELQAAIEADFEGIRSKDSNAHVVPIHCGWFSWTKIHLLEERALPSFFNMNSQTRTPDTYMEIRNWIVKKFHANPNVQIELKDLSELEVADLDAKQEVLEFLDYWGLINFHPFPQVESAANADDDREAKEDSLLEKLFCFEIIQPCPPVIQKPNLSTPALAPGLFPESSLAEELVRPEEPAVEYHCNSCSADCSRKRYHCQKKADYDLCADCFSNGIFGSNMSSSDFILMEPAEAPGLSGGKWTDQETLLLLEALELYKENWNEIAEHVATKIKAQCILHFVQMPIEDVFFDCDDDVDGISKETKDQRATTDDTSVPKDGTETMKDKTGAKEDHPLKLEASRSEEVVEVKGCQETAKPNNTSEAIVDEKSSKSEDTIEVKAAQHACENLALKALTEAFEAVGYPCTPENRLSFAEVGNPVMALAVFLARLVGSDVAVASARSSLKSLNSDSPGMQLATRHCFLLEDPPDDQKGPAGLDCAIETANQDAQKYNHERQAQKDLDGRDLSIDHSDEKTEDCTSEEKQPPDSSNDEPTEKLNAANDAVTVNFHEEVEIGKLKESSDSLQKEPQVSALKELNEMQSKSPCPPSSIKETEGSSVALNSQQTEVSKDEDMVSNLKPSENEPCQSAAPVLVQEPSLAAETSEDVGMISDSLPAEKNEQLVKSNSVANNSQPTEAPKDICMSSELPSEAKESQQPVASNSVVGKGATAAEDHKDSKKWKPNREEIKEDNRFYKFKCAAVSALSAAAVKAKLLANQEEDQIRQLAALLIKKQVHKLEMKLAFFKEMDLVTMRVREQLDRLRQRLYHERAQIIAARLGLPASSSRGMPPTLPTNRIATNCANSIPRPLMSMTSQRPPIARPMGTLSPTPSNPFVSTTAAGSSIRPSGQD